MRPCKVLKLVLKTLIDIFGPPPLNLQQKISFYILKFYFTANFPNANILYVVLTVHCSHFVVHQKDDNLNER